MSTAARISIQQYDRMIAGGAFEPRERHRVELIYGELRHMAALGPEHEEAVDFLNEWSMRMKPAGVKVRIQNSLGFPEMKSAPEPDVAWVKAKSFSKHRPLAADVFLVIEVAYTSLSYDRGKKARLYARAGIQDYWVVNLRDRCVEVFREPLRHHFHSLSTYSSGDELRLLAFPNVALVVEELFAALAAEG